MNTRVEIRRVWQHNLESEFALIQSAVSLYPYVSIDTEFPGTVFQPMIPLRAPAEKYQIMKDNVDATNIIQLGLTLSDGNGNLPHFGTTSCYIWEFNFRDFDIDCDFQNPNSIELLKRQGIDFLQNKVKGIHSSQFSSLLRSSRLVLGSRVTWVTFHSAYDFGFLIKMLNQKPLPHDIHAFMWMVEFYFGQRVYDIKHVSRFCQGLYGGLEKVANTLEVCRVAGKSHQAGSDSLLTLQTFMKLKDMYFQTRIGNYYYCNPELDKFQGVLYGLEVKAH